MKRIAWCLIVWMVSVHAASAQSAHSVESNVVVGMYSGLALLMDVHRPAKPNGFAIVQIAGSAFHRPLSYDAKPLNQEGQIAAFGKPLLDAGFTVFALNHRAAPRFRYPASIEDVQRAVRFIRHHAQRFGVRSDRIGAFGNSSGGYLAYMLGMMDGKGDVDDPDPVSRESAKVQCVVVGQAPADLLRLESGAAMSNYLGVMLSVGPQPAPAGSEEYRTYREASPITYVTADDPPTLILHGDADPVVQFKHSEYMEAALRAQNVSVRFVRVAGGKHGEATFPTPALRNEFTEAYMNWFEQYLRTRGGR